MIKFIFTVIFFGGVLFAKPTLIFYCGSTMSGAINEMAKVFESQNDCNIKIIKGGSGALWKELKNKKQGDLYLPGSDSYRKKFLSTGILKDGQYIGFNKAALIVEKGNPKSIKDLESLIDPKMKVFLCDASSGSIGKNTEKILMKYKGIDFLDDAYDNTIDMGKDAKSVTKAVAIRYSDVGITWRATAFWGKNKNFVDVIEIDDKYAPKKKLVINFLKFSKHPELAKKFMKFSASNEGQAIMRNWGFLK